MSVINQEHVTREFPPRRNSSRCFQTQNSPTTKVPVGLTPQPSLRDSWPSHRTPKVETLGYLQLSLRDSRDTAWRRKTAQAKANGCPRCKNDASAQALALFSVPKGTDGTSPRFQPLGLRCRVVAVPFVICSRRFVGGRRRLTLSRSSLPFVHGLFQDVFNLAIHTAQFVRGPGFQLRPKHGVDPQQKCLSLGHGLRSRACRC